MRTEWTTKLMDDESFTDAIPSNQADFVVQGHLILLQEFIRYLGNLALNTLYFIDWYFMSYISISTNHCLRSQNGIYYCFFGRLSDPSE